MIKCCPIHFTICCCSADNHIFIQVTKKYQGATCKMIGTKSMKVQSAPNCVCVSCGARDSYISGVTALSELEEWSDVAISGFLTYPNRKRRRPVYSQFPTKWQIWSISNDKWVGHFTDIIIHDGSLRNVDICLRKHVRKYLDENMSPEFVFFPIYIVLRCMYTCHTRVQGPVSI